MGKAKPLFISPENMALATDLYELTMAAGYFEAGLQGRFTFELFIRDLPDCRNYLLAAGLEQAVDFVTNFRFSGEAISYLRSLEPFAHISDAFFDYLASVRFTGDICAMREGTVFFPPEPLLVVSAPIIETQILETYLLSAISFQTAVASKAARVVEAAQGRSVVDFGSRRAHGPQAGVLAARASYIGGCTGTSNVLAAKELDIPAVGTAAHSWTMAFDTEEEAFRAYHEAFPDTTLLLIDTYDTIEGARRAAEIGPGLKGVRLDSGDIAELSRRVRKLLDEKGLKEAKIVASGDLNEHKIADILSRGGRVDVFGVGTEMVTSKDAPALSAVYKLVERARGGERTPVVKLSEEKKTLPGAKQVYRFSRADGVFERDLIAHESEPSPPGATPLLVPVIKGGEICCDLPPVQEIRERAREEISRLPARLRGLERVSGYRIEHSKNLDDLQAQAVRRLSTSGKEA